MSTQPASPPVPKWDTADRMRKALRESGISVEEMARYLDVTRRSVGNWINGHINPSTQTLRLWALRTGVSFDWLCHGDNGPCFGTDRQPVSRGQADVITVLQRSGAQPFTNAHRLLPAAA